MRTFDATLLNRIANQPDVRQWLLGKGPLDFTEIVGDPANVALVAAGGGFVGVNFGGGDYEVHSIFERGAKTAPLTMLDGLEYMFLQTDCLRLTTKVPAANAHAMRLAEAGGFTTLFHNSVLDCACMELTIDRWVVANALLNDVGEWFHDNIEDSGLDLPEHPYDPTHDRAVGASVEMIRAGNLAKAVWFYNRWAAHAGYPGISALSTNPPILHMGECLVAVNGQTMEVMPCRSV